MSDCIMQVYETIISRKEEAAENSYTAYLFKQGIDKILKKVGEEASEVIIAAKNGQKEDTVGELCDLTYHLLVLMAQQGITPQDLQTVLEQRHTKAGNLKQMKTVDKNT